MHLTRAFRSHKYDLNRKASNSITLALSTNPQKSPTLSHSPIQTNSIHNSPYTNKNTYTTQEIDAALVQALYIYYAKQNPKQIINFG